MPPIIFHLRSGELEIENSHPGIEHELHYYHRHLVDDPKRKGSRTIKNEKVSLFRVVQESGPRRILTYQGLTDRMVKVCQKCELEFSVLDERLPFPSPRIELAKGFRHGQHLMFLKLLLANRSGILKAPTRYGKTSILVNTLRVYSGIKSMVIAPEADLLRQLVDELSAALPDREVRGIFTGSTGKKESPDITVVSMDSLHKVDHDSVRLVLIDEPHAIGAPTRSVEMMKFKNARVIGYGATTSGRFDGADKLIEGMIGPVLVLKTFPEAVAEGAICPIVVYMVKVLFDDFKPFNRLFAYRRLMFKNPDFHRLVLELSERVIPADWQTIMFVKEIAQTSLIDIMTAPCVKAVASGLKKEEREQIFDEMVSGATKRCMATDIYVTGVTFPNLRCIINLSGGGGSITGTQKPGRLAQNQPGKKAGYLIDFLFECRQGNPELQMSGEEDQREEMSLLEVRDSLAAKKKVKQAWSSVVQESFNRMQIYKKNGYDVRVVDDVNKIILD